MATALTSGYRDVSKSGNVEDANAMEVRRQSSKDPQSADGPPQLERPLSSMGMHMTTRQKLILVTCSCSSCFMHVAMSSIPLLLPPAIIRKEIPYEYCGMIFSVFAISIVIFEPLQAKILPRVGTKNAFVASALLGGICYIAFAMLEFADTTNTFVWPAMCIRFIEGGYYAVLITASNVIVCLEFPDRASFAFGILEGFVGAGFTLGPLLGGALYAAGGFVAPFLFIGLSLLATGILGYFVLEQITGLDLKPKPKETKRLIRDPVFIALAMMIFSMGVVWGIFETTLEPYLSTYDTGPIIEGVVFAIAYMAYAMGSPMWGYIFRKVRIDYRWILIGPVIAGVLWMILGPAPILSFIKNAMWLDTLCLFLLNVTIAFVFVFGYDTMLKRAILCGLEENVATYALIVAAFFTPIYMGETVGPVIGGYVYAKLDFQMVAVVASGILYGMVVLAAVVMLVNWRGVVHRTRRRLHGWFPTWIKEPRVSISSESSPLLSENDENIFQPPVTTGRLSSSHSERSYGSIPNRRPDRSLSVDAPPVVVIL